MQIRKFCLCGQKLERQATDEDTARQVVEAWRLEHTGAGHGPASGVLYKRAIAKLIGKRSRPQSPDELKPLLSPKIPIERIQMDNPEPLPHEYGCNCADCSWIIAAITAQDDSGAYLFTDEELLDFAKESAQRKP